MKRPPRLYRFRPLGDGDLLSREMKALRDSYLFAPHFSEMNDPMEAFYETGGPTDLVLQKMLGEDAPSHIYNLLKQAVDPMALISFASSHEHLPLWAYYASNFRGMCLEFDTDELCLGGLPTEQLFQVVYARQPLPPLTFVDISHERRAEAITSRLTRKRLEWSHEKEWRFVTATRGPHGYLDDALRRVFLGPLVAQSTRKRSARFLRVGPWKYLKVP